jgi:hypothetical protein
MNFLAKLKRAHINTITAQNWITYSNVFLEKRDKIPTNFGAMERIKIHVLPNYIYVNFMLILCQHVPRTWELGTRLILCMIKSARNTQIEYLSAHDEVQQLHVAYDNLYSMHF